MANQLGLSGAQPQKPTRFAPIYNSRFFSGLWTNRSPLRDAGSTRIEEKFYGGRGDALIAGSNVEISNRLTLSRRPGNPSYDSNSYTSVGSFEDFRLSSTTTEQINVMIDQANALYSLYSGTKSLVWTKSAGAGQSYMQAVGNSLYFGNGADNKKWLQTLNVWSAAASWNGATTPILSTFIIDTNGNIQQLLGLKNTTITNVAVASGVLTLTVGATAGLSVGQVVTLWGLTTATFLNGAVLTIAQVVNGTTLTFAVTYSNYASHADSGYVSQNGGTPVSAGSQPTWSTTVPNSGNNFTGGITVDNTALWVNRGSPVENWGITAPTAANVLAPTVGSSRVAWVASTFYSLAGVIIDTNGNLQQVITAGKSGSIQPTWATVVGNSTTDGTVTWRCIQLAASLTWATHTNYAIGSYLKSTAAGVPCLFQLQPIGAITISGSVNVLFVGASGANPGTASGANNLGWSGVANTPNFWNGSAFVAAAVSSGPTAGNSLAFAPGGDANNGLPITWATLNGCGEITGFTNPWAGAINNYSMCAYGTFTVPAGGNYTFSISHDDGMFFGIDGGASLISGKTSNGLNQTQTPARGYPVIGANNNSGFYPNEQYVVNFPAAGTYNFEFAYGQWKDNQTLVVTCNNHDLLNGTAISGPTQPPWPAWTTSYAPAYPSVSETHTFIDGNANAVQIKCPYTWQNLGPIADYVWQASSSFTTPNQTIIDSNGYTQAPYRTGYTGTSKPTFKTGLYQLTVDNPNLIWINKGSSSAPLPGTLSTFNGGWEYAIALVNSLDATVSNCGKVTSATGSFIGASGITFAPGSGLPAAASIDPQADYVAIFRSTDGLTTPFLVPGSGNTFWTVPLQQYLVSGYVDTTPDTGLNNLLSGPIANENTPPGVGAANLTYHLSRIFYSIGNVVYWTSGPDDPVGNGVNGYGPLNFDSFPSMVKRLVPTAAGLFVFTVSDVYVILGQGTSTSPIQKGIPYLQGIGLLSYNALDVNGSIIGMFTTDAQFIIFDPTSGITHASFPIANLLRQNNGQPGTSWNPANVYVAWHVSGEDAAWYLSDGTNGWYRLMPTPAPESGFTWSPFATIAGGVKAIKSVEVTPGVHKLLLGPTATGPILSRDLSTFADNGNSYSAYFVLGSLVLAQPGQVAEVAHITTDSVKIGTPLTLAVLLDEALPYYTSPFEPLTVWDSDPPGLPESRSLLGQRFYLSELKDQAALCRHMQLRINWSSEAAQNELLTYTVYGAYLQES